MSADAKNSLFALGFVLLFGGAIWAGFALRWPEAVVLALIPILLGLARRWVVAQSNMKSDTNG